MKDRVSIRSARVITVMAAVPVVGIVAGLPIAGLLWVTLVALLMQSVAVRFGWTPARSLADEIARINARPPRILVHALAAAPSAGRARLRNRGTP